MATVTETRERRTGTTRARAEKSELIRKVTDLIDLISQTDKSAAVEALRSGLKASRRVFLGKAKGGKGRWGTEPDYRVRHESAMAILAYAFGKPIERTMVASGSFEDLNALMTRINANPYLREKTARIVPSAPIDVEQP